MILTDLTTNCEKLSDLESQSISGGAETIVTVPLVCTANLTFILRPGDMPGEPLKLLNNPANQTGKIVDITCNLKNTVPVAQPT